MQRGFVVGAFVAMTKLVAAVRVVTLRAVAGVVLQVTDSLVPKLESSVSMI